MKTFRTLDMAVEFYKEVRIVRAPAHLKDQLDRASSSISLNLAEGNAKSSSKDKCNYFHTAFGSLRECQTIFKLLDFNDEKILAQADQLGASLYKLVNSDLKGSPKKKKPL